MGSIDVVLAGLATTGIYRGLLDLLKVDTKAINEYLKTINQRIRLRTLSRTKQIAQLAQA